MKKLLAILIFSLVLMFSVFATEPDPNEVLVDMSIAIQEAASYSFSITSSDDDQNYNVSSNSYANFSITSNLALNFENTPGLITLTIAISPWVGQDTGEENAITLEELSNNEVFVTANTINKTFEILLNDGYQGPFSVGNVKIHWNTNTNLGADLYRTSVVVSFSQE